MLRLLAEGTPVARDRVDTAIADLDISPEAAEITLAAWTERDTEGTVRGLGLTYDRTAHRMLIDDNTMWAWCGMDTLIFAVVLGKHVTIESSAPGIHDVVRLHAGPDGVTDAEPATPSSPGQAGTTTTSTSVRPARSRAASATTASSSRPGRTPNTGHRAATTSTSCPSRRLHHRP